jgi:hypothetical protein
MSKNAVNKPLSARYYDFMGQKRGKKKKIEPPGGKPDGSFL